MGDVVVRQPHLGREAVSLLGRIIESPDGLSLDDIEPYLFVRLLRCGYIRRKESDASEFVGTPAGVARWRSESIAMQRRQADADRRAIIRNQVQVFMDRMGIEAPATQAAPAFRPEDVAALAEGRLPVIWGGRAPRTREPRLPAPREGQSPAGNWPEVRIALEAKPEDRLPAPRRTAVAATRREQLPAVRETDESASSLLAELLERTPDLPLTREVAQRFDVPEDTESSGGGWARVAMVAAVAAVVLVAGEPVYRHLLPSTGVAPEVPVSDRSAHRAMPVKTADTGLAQAGAVAVPAAAAGTDRPGHEAPGVASTTQPQQTGGSASGPAAMALRVAAGVPASQSVTAPAAALGVKTAAAHPQGGTKLEAAPPQPGSGVPAIQTALQPALPAHDAKPVVVASAAALEPSPEVSTHDALKHEATAPPGLPASVLHAAAPLLTRDEAAPAPVIVPQHDAKAASSPAVQHDVAAATAAAAGLTQPAVVTSKGDSEASADSHPAVPRDAPSVMAVAPVVANLAPVAPTHAAQQQLTTPPPAEAAVAHEAAFVTLTGPAVPEPAAASLATTKAPAAVAAQVAETGAVDSESRFAPAVQRNERAPAMMPPPEATRVAAAGVADTSAGPQQRAAAPNPNAEAVAAAASPTQPAAGHAAETAAAAAKPAPTAAAWQQEGREQAASVPAVAMQTGTSTEIAGASNPEPAPAASKRGADLPARPFTPAPAPSSYGSGIVLAANEAVSKLIPAPKPAASSVPGLSEPASAGHAKVPLPPPAPVVAKPAVAPSPIVPVAMSEAALLSDLRNHQAGNVRGNKPPASGAPPGASERSVLTAKPQDPLQDLRNGPDNEIDDVLARLRAGEVAFADETDRLNDLSLRAARLGRRFSPVSLHRSAPVPGTKPSAKGG